MSDDATKAGKRPRRLDEMLTKPEVADRLRVSPRTIERWEERRIIAGFKMGHTILYCWEEVQEQVLQCRTTRPLRSGRLARRPRKNFPRRQEPGESENNNKPK